MVRVTLRRPIRSDGPAVIKSHLENRDYHLPWVDNFTDEAGFDRWFGNLATGPNISFLVLDPDSGELAGVINICEIVTGAFQSAYLGYHGTEKHAGRGFLTEGLKKTIKFAFHDLGLHRLEANIQPGNARSIALVRRLGFQKEGFSPRYLKIAGEWRDHERWAILADGPQP